MIYPHPETFWTKSLSTETKRPTPVGTPEDSTASSDAYLRSLSLVGLLGFRSLSLEFWSLSLVLVVSGEGGPDVTGVPFEKEPVPI